MESNRSKRENTVLRSLSTRPVTITSWRPDWRNFSKECRVGSDTRPLFASVPSSSVASTTYLRPITFLEGADRGTDCGKSCGACSAGGALVDISTQSEGKAFAFAAGRHFFAPFVQILTKHLAGHAFPADGHDSVFGFVQYFHDPAGWNGYGNFMTGPFVRRNGNSGRFQTIMLAVRDHAAEITPCVRAFPCGASRVPGKQAPRRRRLCRRSAEEKCRSPTACRRLLFPRRASIASGRQYPAFRDARRWFARCRTRRSRNARRAARRPPGQRRGSARRRPCRSSPRLLR